ncbi:MAG TPA: hypothetical protein VFE12_08185 [Acetobacteraceae bacterium]|nr:hypothetical protein [Acetobacteraceae bacterium]
MLVLLRIAKGSGDPGPSREAFFLNVQVTALKKYILPRLAIQAGGIASPAV